MKTGLSPPQQWQTCQFDGPKTDFDGALPQHVLDDLNERSVRTRWPDELPNTGDRYGVPLTFVQSLVERWRDGYEWRACDAAISFSSGDPSELDGLTPFEQREPDTPAGLLAWKAQSMDGDLDPDWVLTNEMVYWLTGIAASAARFFYEDANA